MFRAILALFWFQSLNRANSLSHLYTVLHDSLRREFQSLNRANPLSHQALPLERPGVPPCFNRSIAQILFPTKTNNDVLGRRSHVSIAQSRKSSFPQKHI